MKCLMFALVVCISSVYAQVDTIYAFRTTNNKILQFLYNQTDSVFTYQFISNGKLELEVVDDLKDQDTIITVDGYYRGGGCFNAHMDWNLVSFSIGNIDYTVYHDGWVPNGESCEDDPENAEWIPPKFGIRVSVDNKEVNIVGEEILIGDINGWSFTDILPNVKHY